MHPIVTHVGVYIGNGYVIEAKGHKYGVVQSKLSGGGWKYWAQCHLIKDDTATKKASSPVVDQMEELTEIISSYAGEYQITAEHGLNMREGAGTANPVIMCMNYGSKCSCDGTFANIDDELWLKVKQGDQEGWSISDYLKRI